MSETIVSIRNISKQFGSVSALSDISLDINAGEIFALLGPSGCGKSTLLRLISGFEFPSSGELLLDGKDLTHLPPNKRPINMVFQSYAVFPHMSVEKNVAYGLKMNKVPKEEIKNRVATALSQVQLADMGKRMPDQLSGGQRQRVALARALVNKPRVLLLDEPLSALDAKLRDAMRLELVKLQESVGITFIIVTHDQTEAMAMADRIAVLESGRLRQVASPETLYHHPVDAFVADFIGNINAFAVASQQDSGTEIIVETHQIPTVSIPKSQANLPVDLNSSMVLAVRPEKVSLSIEEPDETWIKLRGYIGDIAFQGQHCIAEVRLSDSRSITALIGNQFAQTLSTNTSNEVWASWQANDMLLLPTASK